MLVLDVIFIVLYCLENVFQMCTFMFLKGISRVIMGSKVRGFVVSILYYLSTSCGGVSERPIEMQKIPGSIHC